MGLKGGPVGDVRCPCGRDNTGECASSWANKL